MSLSNEDNPHMRLTLAEATIVSANRMMADKPAFLQRLTDLLNHTTDRGLLRDLQSLYDKVSVLSDREFTALMEDAKKGNILFPVNYRLPSIP